MDDVEPRRVPGDGAFSSYRRVHRSHVRFRPRIRGVLHVTGKRYEAYGREDGEDRDHYDELRERERGKDPSRLFRLPNLG